MKLFAILLALLVTPIALAQCPYGPYPGISSWPVTATLVPSNNAPPSYTLVLGPVGNLLVENPAASVSNNEIIATGQFYDWTGLTLPPPSADARIPLGPLPAGPYVVRVRLTSMATPQGTPCPELVLQVAVPNGGASPVALPALDVHTMVLVVCLLSLIAWRVLKQRRGALPSG